MKLIGLTGPTGSGKTTFCEVCSSFGIESINADAVAKEVTESELVKGLLADTFGRDIVNCGKLDRALLAARAFKSSESTELLNRTVLPHIRTRLEEMIKGSDAEYLVLDAPTLFESGINELCDCVVSVISNRDIRYERIISRDKLSSVAANARIDAGKCDEFYISRSNYVIFNNGTEEDFKNESRSVIMSIVNK